MRPHVQQLINEVNSIFDEGLDPKVSRTLSTMSHLAKQQSDSAHKLGTPSAHKMASLTHKRVADSAFAQMGTGDQETDAAAQQYVDFHDHQSNTHTRHAKKKARAKKPLKGTGPGPHNAAPSGRKAAPNALGASTARSQ
jgi:hypothetical protein